MKIVSAICAIAGLILVETGFAQSFQNLGFESATVPDLPAGQYGGYVSSANAFPGWTIYLGTNQITSVLQNNGTLGTASASILSPNWTASMGGALFVGGIIQGNYAAVLHSGNDPFSGIPSYVDASISQTGMVPTNAQSIRLKVYGLTGPTVTASFAGQNLPWTVLGSTPNYLLLGTDISGFAGQVGALTFTASASFIHFNPYNTVELDSVQFSIQAIPEPSASGLFGFGSLLLALFRWRTSSR